jgi:hypothetical protein
MLVCWKCRKRIEIDAEFRSGKSSEGETLFQWRKEYMVPKNPADLEASCGEVIRFRVDGRSSSYLSLLCSIHRSILEERHPNSRLFRLVSERWEQTPYSEIPIDRYYNYFRYVLDFVRDGTVCLPASLLKTCFLDALTYYGIHFDPDDVNVEIDPFVMGRGLLAIIKEEELDGFYTRIIEGHLQKELDDANLKLNAANVANVANVQDLLKEGADVELKLNAAVVAYSIMNCYTHATKASSESFKWEPTDKFRQVILESCGEKDFWKYCNGFLKDFGLSGKFIASGGTILCILIG